jgi:hypothetical protein
MWTVVYMSQNKNSVEQMTYLLEKDGILYKVREITKKRNIEESHFEILVPETEVEEAHSVIVEKGF